MKKEIRTNKMTKRAMALILTMSMVCGMAFTVYAGEEAGENVIEEIAAVETAEAAVSTETPADEAPTVENSGAAELIDAAEAAVVADGLAVEGQDEVVVLQVGQDILEQLQNGEAAVEDTAADLAAAKAAMEAAKAADKAVTDNNAVVDEYNDAVAASEAASKAAVDNAAIANDENSDETTAKAAAEEAQAELATSEEKLQDAKDKYSAAQAAWNEADSQQKEAAAQVAAAEEALENAKTNSAAALAALNAAKAQVEALKNRKADLEDLKDQYYRTMVHFYRDNKIASAVYNADGSLNVEKSAAKAIENGKDVDPSGVSENTLTISRELMRKLIVYKLVANGADEDSIAFAVDGDYKKTASEGTLGTKDGKARVTIDSTYDQYWTSNQNGESGRNHAAKVTYVKDGETVTEYYNYIFKASKYDDDTDFENGMIYLALVKKNDDTNQWKSEKDYDSNNYDDYQKLLAAVDALQNYEATKAAVDAAAAKVAALKDQAEALNNVKAQAQVTEALKDLDAAKEAYENAKAAVEAIDLSRFVVVPKTAVEDDEEDETADTPATAPIISSITAPVVVTPIAPLATLLSVPATFVAAQEEAQAAGEGIVDLEDEILPGAATPEEEAKEELVRKADEILPGAATPVEITNLVDKELPAAGFAGTLASFWWLWLLLILALILAYTIYKYNENKKEEAAK